ncbi:FAD-dependent oxidoreductase [Sphingomonas sp. 4RDLI-65]|uniref:NAD(P)/FAD-dependent oxidoreductase n=1 Tax=Sphingomonas sp. 4RDLI-65 TaxID=3111641 RepID=UPI003C200F30
MRIGIIGAGIAGLSCAAALKRRGHDVVLFDKGRGPGGRMSTRRLTTASGEVGFDHGAQFLTARDPAFVAQVDSWAQAGHVARWPDAGSDGWVGTPAMNAPVRAMADDADVRWNTRIDMLELDEAGWHLRGDGIDAGSFDAAVVAVPAEQVAPLIEPHDPATAAMARATRSDPCWTVMAAYDGRVPIDRDRLVDRNGLASAVRNSAKPGRSGPEAWVLQADADWSRAHLEDDPASVEAAILALFAAEIGAAMPSTIATSTHRWRYAKAGVPHQGPVWLADRRLGVCGDWVGGPRVEAAWLSGQALAAIIA